MRIAYFINTFKSINWGGQATSSGIKHMLEKTYPHAEFVPFDLPDLPFKKIKILRKYYEVKLVKAIMRDDLNALYAVLSSMNIPDTIFDDFTHICFNGEGAVHYKSGHIRLFMGLLYLAKKKRKTVAAVNQTIDLNGNTELEKLLTKVYRELDFISVREPVSYEYAKKLGLSNMKLIPDAVYGLPKMGASEIEATVEKYNLPHTYITLTGSSALKRDKKSLHAMTQIIRSIQENTNLPLVFMANAKTDIWLAHKLEQKFDFNIIEPPVKYKDAMAIIAASEVLIGGRQHPNIFAYIYGVPYIPFIGNTYKNEGVARLQNYWVTPFCWDVEKEVFVNVLKQAFHNDHTFTDIDIDTFKIFD